ncbi:membrane protein DedA with SNARE-associated domain [Paenibacillus sp. PastF-3]|jgi:membrane protein DedA with SNARE-associated domain|uniref:DedA family protein n=1 Tax=unclassified Paenibacillus TaxID=185978 RepID=UPI000BA1320F|nr:MULTISPECIES: DedA family protein [unclassified Paenibacillus]MDH6369909.1 membrane protein DedA with SNARE-associated domain [Paenibacillus sp. PastF-3]OZQ89282.1 alkaline phosphatase [Paenibacillus sp. VTT E-133291]
MHQLLTWISETALHLVNTMGIWGIWLGMILESACIPIPSEVIMLSGGWLVAQGSLTFMEVAVAGIFGNLIGSIIAYYIGKAGGRRLLEKYGKYILLNEHHLEQSERWFDRYGESTVFFTRMLPFIRTFISLPAGIAGMKAWKFIVFTALGCIPWNLALIYLGYRLGDNWSIVEQYIRPISYTICGIVLLLLIWWLVRRYRTISSSRNKKR